MTLTVTLKNNHSSGGRRQLCKTITLKGPEIEKLKEMIKDSPQLQDLLNSLEEVSYK